MGLVLKHVIRTKADTWHYRRRLPRGVAEAIGQGEFKRLLGSTEKEALRNFPKANTEFERLVSEARRRLAAGSRPRTALGIHREAQARAKELALTLADTDGIARRKERGRNGTAGGTIMWPPGDRARPHGRTGPPRGVSRFRTCRGRSLGFFGDFETDRSAPFPNLGDKAPCTL
jgi:hypothetical protein